MNRSILIVICDFLLLSLLAFSTVDINKVGQAGAPQMNLKQPAPAANPTTARQDLGDVMRLALDEERKNRDQLVGELTRERELVTQQNQQMENVRTKLQTQEQLAAQLASERSNLEQQYATAQTNLANLNEQLRANSVENLITKEQRAAIEAEARKQAERAAALEHQMSQLQQSNQLMQTGQQALQTQLALSEASNHSAYVQMAQLHDEVDEQRRQNARLNDGVQILAAKSSELAHEIHDTRPLTPNLIFNQMLTNRVVAHFSGEKSGLFGAEAFKNSQTQVILVTDETNTYALCHVHDTPLNLWNPGTQWHELTGTLAHKDATVPIPSLSFCFTDPRIVVIPVAASDASALGCKIYHLSKDPYIFQDAVVVGTREDYYGECKFQIDTTTPHYLKMDHNSLKGLFGKFNPSSGDLVLSKTGELLGVMSNDSYCAIIRNFEPMAVFRFGAAGKNQPTAKTLSMLYAYVAELPFKLQ